MEGYHATDVRLDSQPTSVNFIDNRLPNHHPLFSGAPVYYDRQLGQYAPQNMALLSSWPTHLGGMAANADDILSRPSLTETAVMSHWNAILVEAMAEFKAESSEPKGRSSTPFSIRDKQGWDEVCEVLESAKEKYQYAGGASGWIRKVRRRAAETVVPVAATTIGNAARLAPDGIFSTPILGAVRIMMDAIKKSVTVRNKVLESLSGLIDIFADAELFLATFPSDSNIKKSSIELATAVLGAIEKTIRFFLRNEYLRGGKAIFLADDYEKSLCESLEKIQAQSASLLLQAEKSHMYDSKIYSQETRLALRMIAKGQQMIHRDITQAFNSMNSLLFDYIQQQDRKLETARQQIIYLTIGNGVLQSCSPTSRTPSPQPPPGTIPPTDNYINEVTLCDIIARILSASLAPYEDNHLDKNLDIDRIDMERIAADQSELPPRQRGQAEQIITTSLFRSFVSAQYSAKLLVQWDLRPPRSFGGISPLSVFCASMIRLLRGSNNHFQVGTANKRRIFAAVWFCGQRQECQERAPSAMLASLALQLLRQGALGQSLRESSSQSGDHTPGLDLAALASLASPSQRQQQSHQEAHADANPNQIVDQLLKVLEHLVCQLPETATVFIVIDGIALYEREEFEAAGALRAFSGLLRLVGDHIATAAVKLLFASTPGTEVVRAAFEDEDLILEMDGLSRLVSGELSEERMAREWEGLGDST